MLRQHAECATVRLLKINENAIRNERLKIENKVVAQY